MKLKGGVASILSKVKALSLSLSRKSVIRSILVLLIFGAFFAISSFVPPVQKVKAAGNTYYVSQSATNGYQIGNDGNNGTSKSTPFLTIGKANSVVALNNVVFINDGTYLTTDGTYGATELLIFYGDWEAQNPLAVVIRGGSTTRVLNIYPFSASDTITIGAIVIDGQTTTQQGATISATGQTYNPTVVFNGTKFLNFTRYGIYVIETAYNLTVSNVIFQSSVSGLVYGIYDSIHRSGAVNINGVQLALTQTGTGASYGIWIGSDVSGSTIEYISNVTGSITTNNGVGTGVVVVNIPNSLIENCNFAITSTNAGQNGIWIASTGVQADGGIIRNNIVTMDAPAGFAIQIGDDTASPGTYANKTNNGKIYGNTVYGTPNRLTGTPHGVSFCKNTGGEMYNNIAWDFSPAFYAEETDTTTRIYNNIAARGYGLQVLYTRGSTGTVFYNNVAYVPVTATAGTDAILAVRDDQSPTHSTGIVFKNNIIYSTAASPRFVLVANSNTATFSNNLYYATNAFPADAFSYQGNAYATFALWSASGHETNGVYGNPLFVNASGLYNVVTDFMLQSTSPAIDAGYDTGITTDYAGNTRRDDFLVANTGGGTLSYYDIGAYEYVAPLAIVPSAPTLSAISTSSINIVINANGNIDTAEYAIENVTNSQWVQADGTLGASEVWQNRVAWGGDLGITNTGLLVNTSYDYKVKARNGDHVETALSGPTSHYTLSDTPTLSSTACPSQTTYCLDTTPDITVTNALPLVTYRYLVDQTLAPNIAAVEAGTADADGSFTVPDGAIHAHATFYIHVISQNLDGDFSTNYGTYKIISRDSSGAGESKEITTEPIVVDLSTVTELPQTGADLGQWFFQFLLNFKSSANMVLR